MSARPHPLPGICRALFTLFAAGVLLCPRCSPALANPASRHRPHPLLVGYFVDSDIGSPAAFPLRNLVTSGTAARLDQINYSSALVRDGRCSLANPIADLVAPVAAEDSIDGIADSPSSPFRGYFHQIEELKLRFPRLKILISLEGRASDFARDAQPENRSAFVASCVDLFLRGHFAPGVSKPGIFDGIDIDWESPQLADAANFRALIEEFRHKMDALHPGLRLSVAVDQSPAMLPGTNFAALAPLVDELGIMNYDYAGPWSATTGFLAPLFSSSSLPAQAASIEQSIAAYKAAGVPARKLLMGLPFYGYGWTDVGSANNGLFQSGQAVRGDRPYRFIRTLAEPSAVFRDPRSRAPWIFDGHDFWTYEDPVSIRYKVSYAARQRLGGVMIWELSGDTENAELLTSAYNALHHPLHAKAFSASKAQSTLAQR
jgi:chitinase